MSLEQIEWGVEPPQVDRNFKHDRLVPTEMVVAAKMRPGMWGRYEFPPGAKAATYAYRLRELGVEAVSRGNAIYFRWPV